MPATPPTAKKTTFADIVKLLVPNQLEAAYADAEKFITLHTKNAQRLTEKETQELAANLRVLIDRSGQQTENALYYLLCDPLSVVRDEVKKALDDGAKAAVGVVVTLLVGQFALAPATALVVATIVVKIIATKGQEKVCAEMAKTRAKRVEEAGQEKKEGN